MGNNNRGASSLLYSAPSPDPSTPPLSSDEYFWITSSATDNNEGGVSISSRRDIPVVYISSREERGNSSSDDGDDDGAVNESRSDENDRRRSSSSSSSFDSNKSGGYRRYTILYCHGHDVDLASVYNHLCTLGTLLNVDVMSFEHEGHGLSLQSRSNATLTTTPATTPTTVKKAEQPLLSLEEQCRADIRTCYHYLIRNRRIPPSNIILYGKSAGSGPVCWLADSLYQKKKKKKKKAVVVAMTKTKTKTKSNAESSSSRKEKWKSSPPLGGIVLHSAFLSHPCGGYVGLSTCSSDYINHLPVYLIHGTMDDVIPIQHSITLYNQFVVQHRRRSFPPFWADGATHWNIEEKYAMAYIKRMQQFVKYCNKMNCRDDGGILYNNTSTNDIDRQRGRRRSLSSRAHSNKSRVDHIATASLGDGGVEAFLVHERRQRPNHPTISPTSSSSSSSSHNSRSRVRRMKQRGILVMRGSVNDDR